MVCTPRMRTQGQEKGLAEAQRDKTAQEEREEYEAQVMSSRIALVFDGTGCMRYLDGLDDSIPRETVVRMPRMRETPQGNTALTACPDSCLKFPAAEAQDKDEALVKASRMSGETKAGCKI